MPKAAQCGHSICAACFLHIHADSATDGTMAGLIMIGHSFIRLNRER